MAEVTALLPLNGSKMRSPHDSGDGSGEGVDI